MIISICSYKNGVGCSLLSWNLANLFQLTYFQPDKNSSYKEYNKKRQKYIQDIYKDSLDLQKSYLNKVIAMDFCENIKDENNIPHGIYDIGSQNLDKEYSIRILKNSDCIIVPTFLDYDTHSKTSDTIDHIYNQNEDANIIVLLNRLEKRVNQSTIQYQTNIKYNLLGFFPNITIKTLRYEYTMFLDNEEGRFFLDHILQPLNYKENENEAKISKYYESDSPDIGPRIEVLIKENQIYKDKLLELQTIDNIELLNMILLYTYELSKIKGDLKIKEIMDEELQSLEDEKNEFANYAKTKLSELEYEYKKYDKKDSDLSKEEQARKQAIQDEANKIVTSAKQEAKKIKEKIDQFDLSIVHENLALYKTSAIMGIFLNVNIANYITGLGSYDKHELLVDMLNTYQHIDLKYIFDGKGIQTNFQLLNDIFDISKTIKESLK